MKHLVKVLTIMALLMITANCQKDKWDPVEQPSYTQQEEAVQLRGEAEDAFLALLETFRTDIQALIDEGILNGTNGTGILNRIDNIEKKFLKGQEKVAVNMLDALISHLESLNDEGVITEATYLELLEGVQNINNAMEYDCSGPATPVAWAGLNINLPPSGSVTLSPEIFIAYCANECADFAVSYDPNSMEPDAELLELSCSELGENFVRVWATAPGGSRDYADTYFFVQDNFDVCEGGTSEECAPIAIAHHELVTELNMQGEVTIEAESIDAGSIDACSTGNLSFSVRRAGEASDPATAITFTLDDVGSNPVELWVSDGTHSSMVKTSIKVEDNLAP